ncbi:MAG: tyrosine-type recombinase/integrase [Actinomycetota bacterium]
MTGRGPVIVEPKTAGSRRTVALPGYLIEILVEHLDRHVDAAADSLLFTNSNSDPVRRSVWHPAWDEARKAAGLDDLRLHDLRHLAGTLTAQAGATLKETMAWLGHTSVAAALRYQHVAANRNAEIAGRMDDLIRPSSEPM